MRQTKPSEYRVTWPIWRDDITKGTDKPPRTINPSTTKPPAICTKVG